MCSQSSYSDVEDDYGLIDEEELVENQVVRASIDRKQPERVHCGEIYKED